MSRDGSRDRRAVMASTLGRLAAAVLVLSMACACDNTTKEGSPIRVAAPETPQGQLLGQLVLIMLEERGYPVVDHTQMRSERAVRQALAAGSVDVSWAYTGDTWATHLDHDIPIQTPDLLYQRVRDEDALNGITWLSPSPHGRSLGILMAPARAQELGVYTCSQLAAHVRGKDSSVSLAAPSELYDNPTGVRGFESVYSFSFRQDRVTQADAADGYAMVADGQVDCALGYAYESEILGHELTSLTDDLGFFVYGHLALGIRAPLLSEYDGLRTDLLRLCAALSHDTMVDLGRQVEIDGKDPERVARRFLRNENLIGSAPETEID